MKIIDSIYGLKNVFDTFYRDDTFSVCSNSKATVLRLSFSPVAFLIHDFEIFIEGDMSSLIKSKKDCFNIIIAAEKLGEFLGVYDDFVADQAIKDYQKSLHKMLGIN